MSEHRKLTWLLAGKAVAFAVFGGLVIRFIPFLQHWAFYVLWGPVFAISEVRLHSTTIVYDRKTGASSYGPRDLVGGLIIGLTHFVAVTIVWYAVSRGLVLKVDDGTGP